MPSRRPPAAGLAPLAALALFAAGCASSPNATPPAPGSPGYQAPVPPANQQLVQDLPKWFLDPPRNAPNFIVEPATATSGDLQVALDKAQLDGRNRIAQQLEVKYSSLGKRFQEETGAAAGGSAAGTSELVDQWSQTVKATVNQSLVGSRAREQTVKPEGAGFRAYVLMEMPVGKANQNLLNQIREQQSLYTRLRATQAFRELEGEVASYQKSAGASTP